MVKNIFSSKRFWTGLIATITSLSLIFTGEKTFTEQLPFVITTGLALIQTVIALTSTAEIITGWRD